MEVRSERERADGVSGGAGVRGDARYEGGRVFVVRAVWVCAMRGGRVFAGQADGTWNPD